MNKKIKLFILLSVIMNLVCIGIFLGHGMQRYGVKRGDQIIELIDHSSIPEARQQELIWELKQVLPPPKHDIQNNPFHRKLQSAMTADPFDKEAYREALSNMLNDRHDHKMQMSNVMVEIAAELNLQERKKLAAIFQKAKK